MKNREIEVRGAKVHNLKNIDINIPLNEFVGISGISGSGKTSLAQGVLYAEGSRRYLEALSTYTRRRISQNAKPQVVSVTNIPPALSLKQNNYNTNPRSTFGTSTELLNVLRLIFSRLSSHKCPNGHYNLPTINVAMEQQIICSTCKVNFYAPGAEELSFNSTGACPKCEGLGQITDVNNNALVPDKTISINDGAVLSWKRFGTNIMEQVAEAMGVRVNIPFNQLTEKEIYTVFYGSSEKKDIVAKTKAGRLFELNYTYINARDAVLESVANAKSQSRINSLKKYITSIKCPECKGRRLSPKALAPKIGENNLADITSMSLKNIIYWTENIKNTLPKSMLSMAKKLIDTFLDMAQILINLGVGYLSLDRATTTLSMGERQRIQLARTVRNDTTGVLYIFDEPTAGLHPTNFKGVFNIVDSLLEKGNSVIIVDHDINILNKVEHLIEIGPGSGKNGGKLVAQGTIADIIANENSVIRPFLSYKYNPQTRKILDPKIVQNAKKIVLEISPFRNLHEANLSIPKNTLTTITGVSGSGKTSLILHSLATALMDEENLPEHVKKIIPAGIKKVEVIDSSPIGANSRSTISTYSKAMDRLRQLFSETGFAKENKYSNSDFSYNTGALRCPRCNGVGTISLDIQFLPDEIITCPECNGSRFQQVVNTIKLSEKIPYSLPEILSLSINETNKIFEDDKIMQKILAPLALIGIGYLTLGESTAYLSGGELQRLKIASKLDKDQKNTLFIFDEPSIGLHPLDIQQLLKALQNLIDKGATIITIEHDLDVMINSDYIVNIGPGGGDEGGFITDFGDLNHYVKNSKSETAHYLRDYMSNLGLF